MEKLASADLKGKKVMIDVKDTSIMDAYFASPSQEGTYPAVIIGFELFGLTAHIKNIADALAQSGYLVVIPNFYHRNEQNVDLPYDQSGRTKGFELLHQVSRESALLDIKATMKFLEGHSNFSGKIGFLGFSIGGHIGYLAAAHLDISACVIFYAGWLTSSEIALSQPEPTLTLTHGIANRNGHLLYFVGENDFLITNSQVNEIKIALETNQISHEVIVYPNAQHGFFCDERETFDESARDNSWKRTLEFFASTLN